MEDYVMKVEEGRPAADGKPSAGLAYRCIYAKDGLMEIPPALISPWDFFSESVKKFPKNPMLGRRLLKDGKGDKCGIYGVNCPEWIMAMEACNSQAITYVPLYDSLGANAVEFIIHHAEVSIAFVHESKFPAILSCLSKCASNLKTIVSFGKVSDKQKEAAEELGVTCFSWEEFALLGDSDGDLPPKKKTDTLTIMYTSGTTGEPKGLTYSIKSLRPIVSTRAQSIGFWQGDIRFLIEDLVVLKPTIFCGVPRVFDRIYTGIMDKISAGGSLKKSLFQIAYNYKLRNLEKGLKQEEASPLWTSSFLIRHSGGSYDHDSRQDSNLCLRWDMMLSRSFPEVMLVNGSLKWSDEIIDRKKNIFKLHKANMLLWKVSKAPTHNALSLHRFESFLVAVVVPERKALEDWAVNSEEKGDFTLLCNNPKARKYILDELNKTAKQHMYAHQDCIDQLYIELKLSFNALQRLHHLGAEIEVVEEDE
ncbi:hypothetical protein SASPL_157742 [Salvia splendens]|uniref:AMP-dependent synthetase/ligase domain-containing protein n=1 Tax=Salvia splendens TaxID=180675 RepID=A0A8X8VUF8_SALSN|nr:hypothetical protein SASPL_157742 [Salvia splendens]